MKEICRNPRALSRFLALRRQERLVMGAANEALRDLESAQKKTIIRFRRTIFDTEETTATPQDIEDRRRLQARRYWKYQAEGKLTREWTAYGRRHVDEIANLFIKGSV